MEKNQVSIESTSPVKQKERQIVTWTPEIQLEKRPVVHSVILCLVPGVITVLGGLVQTLHEEWEMNQKYLGFSRSSVKPARENEPGRPPPFEKLQIGKLKPSSSQNA